MRFLNGTFRLAKDEYLAMGPINIENIWLLVVMFVNFSPLTSLILVYSYCDNSNEIQIANCIFLHKHTKKYAVIVCFYPGHLQIGSKLSDFFIQFYVSHCCSVLVLFSFLTLCYRIKCLSL